MQKHNNFYQHIKKIGIITYQAPHLKTEQVLERLLAIYGGGDMIVIYALPFIKREERVVLFAHRPHQSEAISAEEIAQKYHLAYKSCLSDEDIDNECDVYIIAGCGILSQQCLKGKKILNAHPGMIPTARGLDAFKWAILQDKPLGVTLHYIDEKIDEGEIIAIIPTPIYPSDTLHTLARRHYENEIATLSNFETYLQNPCNNFTHLAYDTSTKRMNLAQEKAMMEHFWEYKEKFKDKEKVSEA